MSLPDPHHLPSHVRFRHLEHAGIVNSWTQLLRMIEHEGFPQGLMLSANVRVWRLDEVEAWLASRPTARKAPPPASKPRGRPKAGARDDHDRAELRRLGVLEPKAGE
jgi:predicted DNA-binding transcriptional regulator AlpA